MSSYPQCRRITAARGDKIPKREFKYTHYNCRGICGDMEEQTLAVVLRFTCHWWHENSKQQKPFPFLFRAVVKDPKIILINPKNSRS
jgi:hypothetical protein